MRTVLPAPHAFNDNVVTPGVIGFLAIFLIAVATVLLIVDMTRRIRRTRYRGELAERRAQAAASGDDQDD